MKRKGEMKLYIVIISFILFRSSPWLLAVTLVGLTQASHDLLKEEGVFSKLSSSNDDAQEIKRYKI